MLYLAVIESGFGEAAETQLAIFLVAVVKELDMLIEHDIRKLVSGLL